MGTIRTLRWASLLLIGLGLAACGDDNDSAPTDDGGMMDADMMDADMMDAAVDAGPQAPAAATITAPLEGDSVFGHVTVAGTGEANAALRARILLATTELATTTGTIGADGSFSVDMTYLGATHQDALTVEVILSNAQGDSPAATVGVVHDAPSKLSGTIQQTGGNNEGTQVYIRVYTSNAPSDLLDYVAEITLPVTDALLLPETAFEIPVADGTYFLRAFRDSNDKTFTGPDGQPTLPIDAQSPAYNVVVSGDTGGVAMTMTGAGTPFNVYTDFNVATTRASAEPYPPSRWNGGSLLVGDGLCGGLYMYMVADIGEMANAGTLSPPLVKLPSGDVRILLNDGGCSENVRDNTASSYDEDDQDRRFSGGIKDPTDAATGDYTFFYHQDQDDFVHIEVDAVDTVLDLGTKRWFTSPDNTTTSNTTSPTLTWKAVPGANYYGALIVGLTSGFTALFSDTPSVKPTLADDQCYAASVYAVDAAGADEDIDAVAVGAPYYFCVDQAQDNSIVVKGDITNQTDAMGPIVIEAEGSSGTVRATRHMNQSSTSYAVGILTSNASDDGRIEAFIDVAGTCSPDSPENQAATFDASEHNFQANATVDITFTPAVELISPDNLATVTSKPKFEWTPYGDTAGTAAPSNFVHAVFVSSGGGGIPESIWALPPTAGTYDLASPPSQMEAFDVVALASCAGDGGGYALNADGSGTCTGGNATPSQNPLSLGTYGWGVVVIECQWPDFSNASEREGFVVCLGSTLASGTIYAESKERALSVQ